MGEFIKRMADQTKKLWGKWSILQKIILIGICVAAIVGIVALFTVSSAPTMVPVIDAPIRDESLRNRIVARINQEDVRTQVTANNVVLVNDAQTARRMRTILIREDLLPSGVEPWAVFDRERWTTTDLERNINIQRALTQIVTNHIRAIDEIDNAFVTLVFPRDTLFLADRDPVSASVIITPAYGSDITENKKKIEGIQKLLKFAVAGLRDENIVISDNYGNVLNDFDGMAEFERLDNIKRGAALIRSLESQYRIAVLRQLQNIFTPDRVRDLNVKFEMDLSEIDVTKEVYDAIILNPRTPGLAYDDSQRVSSIPVSENVTRTTYRGTGVNPEGPPGAEGQTPPAFRDMQNMFGEVEQETRTTNNALNRTESRERRVPTPNRVTVSANIDGQWLIKYDERGRPVMLPHGAIDREYVPIPPEDLRDAERLIQNAIGYNAARGDAVTVVNIRYDRLEEFRVADAAYLQGERFRTTILIGLAIVVGAILIFLIFRAISKEMDRRRRLQEEERARQEQAARERMLMEAEGESEIPLSPEEQARMNLYENIATMAKEHPDAVAQLIRTWLLEE